MKLKFTPAAIRDLQELKKYISSTLHNPAAANRISKNILDACSSLKEYPQLEMDLSAKTQKETDLRYLLSEKHLVIYRVEGELILIARILDGRTDYMQILFK